MTNIDERTISVARTRIFLSYAREDQHRASPIYELLVSSGFDPWMDVRNLVGGMDWEAQIEREIKRCDMFFLLLSTQSVSKRGIIQKEIRAALRKAEEYLPGDIFIVPVLLEPCEVPDSLRKYQWVDASRSGWETALIRTVVEGQRQVRGADAFSIEGGGSYPIVMEDVEEEQAGRQIQYQLPRLIIPGDEKRSREINEVAIGSIRRYVLEYRAMFDDWEPVEGAEGGSYMDLAVSVATCNADFYSMHFPIHNYFQGAAHPNTYFETLNIFIPNVKLVSLESIFSEASGYVEFLRQEAAADVVRELDGEVEREYVDEQIRQDWVKFDKFTLHKDGMTFLFGDLLAHVYGPQIADISGKKLEPYLGSSPVSQRLRALWNIFSVKR